MPITEGAFSSTASPYFLPLQMSWLSEFLPPVFTKLFSDKAWTFLMKMIQGTCTFCLGVGKSRRTTWLFRNTQSKSCVSRGRACDPIGWEVETWDLWAPGMTGLVSPRSPWATYTDSVWKWQRQRDRDFMICWANLKPHFCDNKVNSHMDNQFVCH